MVRGLVSNTHTSADAGSGILNTMGAHRRVRTTPRIPSTAREKAPLHSLRIYSYQTIRVTHINHLSVEWNTMPSRSSRLAWLEPTETDEVTLSPPHWLDFLVPGSIQAYSSVAVAGISSAALAIALGLRLPAVFAMVAVAHCVVAGLIAGGSAMTARAWPIGKAKSSNQTKRLLSVPQ